MIIFLLLWSTCKNFGTYGYVIMAVNFGVLKKYKLLRTQPLTCVLYFPLNFTFFKYFLPFVVFILIYFVIVEVCLTFIIKASSCACDREGLWEKFNSLRINKFHIRSATRTCIGNLGTQEGHRTFQRKIGFSRLDGLGSGIKV